MNENNDALIGTPVNLTVFSVVYEYSKPPRVEKVPKSAKKEIDKVQNRVIVSSSDPSGRDLFLITQRLVLGTKLYDGHDFKILAYQRMFDVMGLATVTTWDKLDGKAPEDIGVIVTSDDEDDGNDGGSIPPGAELN